MLALPFPVQAALGITDVQPRTISANTSVNLVVTGTDFVDGAVVVLSNYGALDTSFVSATNLTAMLPAGIPAGVYSLTVLNPDSSSATLPGALTVSEPTPTTQPPANGATATPFVRPLIVVDTYNIGADAITPGQDFDLVIRVHNIGGREAVNLIATFTPGDVVPRESGGVLARIELVPGETKKLQQPMTATRELFGKSVAAVVMQLSYTDLNGTAYTETFNLSLPVRGGGGGPAPTATPTPTATAAPRPQIVITGYRIDLDMLKPGSRFGLELQAENVGNGRAQRVTMILGGGTSSSGGAAGTPEPGGVSGTSGDFGNFAPVAASNVQFLGDISTGQNFSARADLIVNAKTEPGAYPMKISFTYTADNGTTYTDDQVVTLLVYSPPNVEVNFYQDPGPIFAGQPNRLPLQVVNLGRKSAVLGNMRVSTEGAELSQNTVLVGPLDIGGYYTLDATLIPFQPGPLDLIVSIDYTDDFNASQEITRTISLEVQEMVVPVEITPEPGTEGIPGGGGFPGPGGEPTAGPETFLQKAWRFVRGLLGLDSAQTQPGGVPGELLPGEAPVEEAPPAEVPIRVPIGPKG
jgi:hypothetical protein